MAEYTDDTKTFTIALKQEATPAPAPVSSSNLQWIADNYDANGSRYIDTGEMQQAVNDGNFGKINAYQRDMVVTAWQNNTLLPSRQTALPTPVSTAKGELRDWDYPRTADPDSTISVSCKVKNTGTATGNFRVELTGGSKSTRTTTFTVYAGQTSPTKTLNVRAPSSGASVTCVLKCIRIT